MVAKMKMSRTSSNRVLVVFTMLAVVAVSIHEVHAGCCCPTYWTAFNENCYRFFGKNKTFTDAELACQEYTIPSRMDNRTSLGHLVSIHSQEEHNFVYTFFMTSGKDEGRRRLWLGLHDRSTEGEFEWTDGTPLDFTMWSPGQPDDWSAREDCGEMTEAANANWNDLPCGAVWNYFMCKLPMW